MGKLTGKIAIITGSDSGMGQAMAAAFAREGADVAVTWHTDEQGAHATAVIDGGLEMNWGQGA